MVPPGSHCAVDVPRCVGLDEEGFAVIDGSAGIEIHFCARHALAAEALVSYAGFRGAVVPALLRRLDSEGDGPELTEAPEREGAPRRDPLLGPGDV